MPASYMHEAITLDIFDLIAREDAPDSTPKLPENRKAALLAGAQGPDPFFFYRFFQPVFSRPVSALGSRIHEERTADFLLTLVNHAAVLALAPHGNEAVLAYALGFLAHFAIDSTVHPFVYARAYDRDGRYNSNLHCGLEAAMDTWFYHLRGQRGIPRQMAGISALPKADGDAIAKLLADTIRHVFPDAPLNAAVVLDSFVWAARISRLLYSPTGCKRFLFAHIASLAGDPGLVEAHALPRRLPQWDFANAAALAWSSPWTPEKCCLQTLPELTATATRRGHGLCAAALALWRGEADESALRAALGDLHYDSGLPWRDTAPIRDGQARRTL